MKAIIPVDPDDLNGASVTTGHEHFDVRADRGQFLIIEFFDLPESIDWFDDFEFMYAERSGDSDTIKVTRHATDEEVKRWRVPIWIQGEHIPECCDKPMFFVGQIDDDNLCLEGPKRAVLWWHDKASFYVFTCPYCLGVKAIGQQF